MKKVYLLGDSIMHIGYGMMRNHPDFIPRW